MQNVNSKIANNILGYAGRMISGSKSRYRTLFPENIVVFNANICTADEKIWFGDIDITLDKQALIELASALSKEIYILREMDGRFENETTPLLEHAVITVHPDRTIVLHPSTQRLVLSGYKL
jgi:hypothetical protein